MQQSYLTKHQKRAPSHLPSLNNRKSKNSMSQINKLREPTQQSLLLEIQDIDQSLNNKNFNYRHGNLFSNEISDRLINQLHACLKKKVAIIEDGFGLWSGQAWQGQNEQSKSKRLTNKLETLNEKMAKLSLENVYEYDLRKYVQIMKINKNRWSLFKRVEQQDRTNKVEKDSTTQITDSKFLQKNQNPLKDQKFSNQSISIKTSLKSSPKGKQPDSQHTTLSPLSKQSKIIQSHNQSRVKNSRQKKHKYKRHVLTQISQMPNPQDDSPQISKYDIRKMLRKQQNIISIWLPPSTYPQFNGIFTYVISQKSSVCRLKKLFFFRRSINQRFMTSLMEQISSRENKYIEGVEIITNRSDYIKIYEPIGWKMRSVEGMDKIRIRYTRQRQ